MVTYCDGMNLLKQMQLELRQYCVQWGEPVSDVKGINN